MRVVVAVWVRMPAIVAGKPPVYVFELMVASATLLVVVLYAGVVVPPDVV
jgi:hypothetical protein